MATQVLAGATAAVGGARAAAGGGCCGRPVSAAPLALRRAARPLRWRIRSPCTPPHALLDRGARRLVENGLVYEELFPLRFYEVGTHRNATIVSIANMLQEVAANHAQLMWGEGTWAPPQMTAQNMAFALSKLHIRMDAPVQWGTTVRVSSWFGEAGTLAARREWELRDAASGARLGAATSTWIAFSLETRRMARLPPALRTWFLTDSPQPPRWALGEAFAPERCAELAADAACTVSSATRVRRGDLDMNRHVNNASYLKWLLEDVPSCVHEGAFAAGADIEFRAETHFGDDVISRSSLRTSDGRCLADAGGNGGKGSTDEDACLDILVDGDAFALQHALLRTRDGVELLRARTHWRPLR